MKIALVKNDLGEAERIIAQIDREFEGVTVKHFLSEFEFFSQAKELVKEPPNIFVFDMQLPWKKSGGNQHVPSHAKNADQAGIRCMKLVHNNPNFTNAAIIIHTVLDVGAVRGNYTVGYERVSVLPKVEENENLMAVVRNIAIAQGVTTKYKKKAEIFVVHGHDDEAKETVARFIEKLGGHAIVLHEQPNAGRTIIEKFEHHANVSFAVVLLTPDDFGGESVNFLKPRARQNVVFELGFFFAKLGRSNVCALHKEDVEIPSDIQGVIYTPMDKSGAWRVALARELKAAGISLDYDKVI
jgi:predicted nucleotide-binding protein